MKKKIVLIIILILLIPVFVNAEDQFTEVYYPKSFTKFELTSITANEYYSDSIKYENGIYELTGNVMHDSLEDYIAANPGHDYYYICGSPTTCRSIHAVFPNTTFNVMNSTGLLSVELINGETAEDKLFFYIGNDYKYENGEYHLVDYEKHNITEVTSKNFFSKKYKDKYICPDSFGVSCNNMVKLLSPGNWSSYGEELTEAQIFSTGYQYKDGLFYLTNPKLILPFSTTETKGYTCISKESTCDNLYEVTISDEFSFRDGRERYYQKVNINDNTASFKYIELDLKDEYILTDYFTENELENAFSTDESIVSLENKNLVLKKVGEASIIYEEAEVYKELQIKVTTNAISEKIEAPNNPKTSTPIIALIILLLIAPILIRVYKSNKNLIL